MVVNAAEDDSAVSSATLHLVLRDAIDAQGLLPIVSGEQQWTRSTRRSSPCPSLRFVFGAAALDVLDEIEVNQRGQELRQTFPGTLAEAVGPRPTAEDTVHVSDKGLDEEAASQTQPARASTSNVLRSTPLLAVTTMTTRTPERCPMRVPAAAMWMAGAATAARTRTKIQ
eukprot:CAMPEP_0204112790 /NCGR_PEP_ID=MMETSP0361-20130328/3267_1 /ASSEMBLY_ACC=CAM_ASM_000343 /TAXON_ID=268821 /ORGANISM="Scrippsiella Hangoei, Strain SHTV-5" /LENGTH=169 /DNA_ID=CAMNT_0051063053 /DNA_START=883 /DNA_END=1393 /DNA_ORIENTATION=+